MIDNYEINKNTMCLLYFENKTYVYELNGMLITNDLPTNIIKNNCKYYGSSYSGRIDGTRYITGMKNKLPIIIEETREIIFFPTISPRLYDCSWINGKFVKNIIEISNDMVQIIFVDNQKININISYSVIENQIFKSSRLESLLHYRKSVNIV